MAATRRIVSERSVFVIAGNASPKIFNNPKKTGATLEHAEFKKAKIFVITEVLEYVLNSIVIKTIIRKTTGNVTAVSFDSGEVLSEKVSPFDTFIQIVDGTAEIVIDDTSNLLETGESIIVPAHARNMIRANVRFKMISTLLKSGYEEVS